MTRYVFDTEPLIAYLYDEPGAAAVREYLETVIDDDASGAVAHATAVEIVYKIARLETGDPMESVPTDAELAIGREDLRVLRGFGLSVETPPARTVSKIKAPGGISLGDAYSAALALDRDATLVVGSDPEFSDIAEDLTVTRI